MIDGGLILIIFGFALGFLTPNEPARRPRDAEMRSAHASKQPASADSIDDDLVRGIAAIATIYENH